MTSRCDLPARYSIWQSVDCLVGLCFLQTQSITTAATKRGPICRQLAKYVALTKKRRCAHGNLSDRSSDLTTRPIRPLIANLRPTPERPNSATQPASSVPNRHQTKHHPARPSMGTAPECGGQGRDLPIRRSRLARAARPFEAKCLRV
jgi:hypothetical protein